MKDLRLGMNILATSTCYLDNEVFKLEVTTLADAYESDSSHVKELRIKLGEGHWGACPTRSRSQICINSDEIKAIANKTLVYHIENTRMITLDTTCILLIVIHIHYQLKE